MTEVNKAPLLEVKDLVKNYHDGPNARNILDHLDLSVNEGDFLKNVQIYGIILAFGLVLLVPGLYSFFEKHRKHPVFTVMLLVLFWACVYSLSNAAGNPFMYFKF